MDYCSSCRRTLNGALVCPGCGAYAPDIAPPAPHDHDAATTVTAAEAWHTRGLPASADHYDAPHAGGPEPTASGAAHASEDPMADASDAGPFSDSEYTAAPMAEGRAARRRQLARWKKQRRRAVVASTVALVGGGLTLAVLPSRPSSGHDTQASATPEPKATATTGTDATETDSSSVRPRTDDPRESGNGAHSSSSAITSPPRKSTAVVTRISTKEPGQTTIAARPTATTSTTNTTSTTTSTQARTSTPVTADTAPTTLPQAPETTTPAPAPPPPAADDATADTPPPSTPPATTKPDRLCVLVLCIGKSSGN
ncbi:hypothetical protein ACFRKB_23265 [Streptomyces scopuliridis]|uniref:SCO2400 family protein n=1 Tax=Streptomyces scopuliridis TaxID=452529 RepID=UPI00369B92BD